MPNSDHNWVNERFVVYTIAGTIALTPIIVAAGPLDEISAVPHHAPHQYHVEISVSAMPLIAGSMANVPPGPNFRIEVEAAELSITGHAPNLIVSG